MDRTYLNCKDQVEKNFYQASKHTILMVERDGAARSQYPNILRYEIQNGNIILYLDDGSTATFPDDGSWLMFDLTPTLGWNNHPGYVPGTVPKKRQVAINLIRRRDCEGSVWADNLYLIIGADEFSQKKQGYWNVPSNVEDMLRDTVQNWLSTQAGWKANLRASLDFNWGDLIMELPIEVGGITLTHTPIPEVVNEACVSIYVNQDELLALDWVSAEVRKSDGSVIGTAHVDFTTGKIYSLTSDQVLPRYNEPLVVVTQWGEIPAGWDKEDRCPRLLE